MIGSGSGNSVELVTPEECREFAMMLLGIAADAERWKPPETPTAKRRRARKLKQLEAVT